MWATVFESTMVSYYIWSLLRQGRHMYHNLWGLSVVLLACIKHSRLSWTYLVYSLKISIFLVIGETPTLKKQPWLRIENPEIQMCLSQVHKQHISKLIVSIYQIVNDTHFSPLKIDINSMTKATKLNPKIHEYGTKIKSLANSSKPHTAKQGWKTET